MEEGDRVLPPFVRLQALRSSPWRPRGRDHRRDAGDVARPEQRDVVARTPARLSSSRASRPGGSSPPRRPRRARARYLPPAGAMCFTTGRACAREPLPARDHAAVGEPGDGEDRHLAEALVEAPRRRAIPRAARPPRRGTPRAPGAPPPRRARRAPARAGARRSALDLLALDRVAHGAEQQPLIGLPLDEVILRSGLDSARAEHLVVVPGQDHDRVSSAPIRGGARPLAGPSRPAARGRGRTSRCPASRSPPGRGCRRGLILIRVDALASAFDQIGVAGIVLHQQDRNTGKGVEGRAGVMAGWFSWSSIERSLANFQRRAGVQRAEHVSARARARVALLFRGQQRATPASRPCPGEARLQRSHPPTLRERRPRGAKK